MFAGLNISQTPLDMIMEPTTIDYLLVITFSCLPSRISASNDHEPAIVGCRDKPLLRAMPQYDHWLDHNFCNMGLSC
jgi:hypothetical protein